MSPASTIVITGVSSFIGMHLAAHFAASGVHVVGTISRPPEQYDGIQGARLQQLSEQGVLLATLDITIPEELAVFAARHKPDLWFHHAGWAQNYGSPEYDLVIGHRVNVLPLDALYPLLKKHGCRGVIVTGSSAEYSDSEHACQEGDACRPAMPYGLSKLSETIRAGQLAVQYELPTRVARVFIPYGLFDSPQKLIPSVVSALMKNQPVDLSPCLQKRDFIHVGDLVQGFGALADDLNRDETFDIFNLCSGEATELKTFLSQITELLGADPSLLKFGVRPMRPGEPPVSYGDASKAKTLLGWQSSALQDSLKRYLDEEVRTLKPMGAH